MEGRRGFGAVAGDGGGEGAGQVEAEAGEGDGEAVDYLGVELGACLGLDTGAVAVKFRLQTGW